MLKYMTAVAVVFMSTMATAHELTPTYPKFTPSYIDGVLVTKMKLWNRRKDVSYYEVQLFDEDWKPISFAAESRLIKMGYLEQKSFDLYIRESDLAKVEFICTTSKLLKDEVESTGITSKICSRVK